MLQILPTNRAFPAIVLWARGVPDELPGQPVVRRG
jgi:hypothetical protein